VGLFVEIMTSPIWKYFVKLNALEAKCNFCGALLKTGGGTTNVRVHLKNKHKEQFLALQTKSEDSEMETSAIASSFVTDSSGTIITDVVVLDDKSEVDASAKKKPKAKRKKVTPTYPSAGAKDVYAHTDRYEAFANTVALRLRDISDKNQRLIAEKVINDILFSAEMGQLAYNPEASVNHPSIVSYISSYTDTS